MEQFFLLILIFLALLAIFDLFVGVSNDAVNFLKERLTVNWNNSVEEVNEKLRNFVNKHIEDGIFTNRSISIIVAMTWKSGGK